MVFEPTAVFAAPQASAPAAQEKEQPFPPTSSCAKPAMISFHFSKVWYSSLFNSRSPGQCIADSKDCSAGPQKLTRCAEAGSSRKRARNTASRSASMPQL
jgi:hypothetical protein